jgi:hypothetical protein
MLVAIMSSCIPVDQNHYEIISINLMVTPVVLPESRVKPFKFYRDSNIYEGIMHDRSFYKLVSEFDLSNYRDSFRSALGLAEQYKVILTMGMSQHRVWTEIQ